MRQDQFLEVLDRDEAELRWRAALEIAPLPEYQELVQSLSSP